MWWQTIIIDVLSVTSLLSIIAMIRFWKQNKKLKDNEVKVSDINTQKEQMDLITKYRDEMVTMIDLVKKANEKNFYNQDEILAKLDRLDARVEKLELNYNTMADFLDGPYHRYWAEQEEKTKEEKIG